MQLLTIFCFLFSFGATVIEAAVIGNGQSITLEHGPLKNALATNSSMLNDADVRCGSSLPPAQEEAIQDSCFDLLDSMDHSTVVRTFGTTFEANVRLPQLLMTSKVFSTFVASL